MGGVATESGRILVTKQAWYVFYVSLKKPINVYGNKRKVTKFHVMKHEAFTWQEIL